MGLAGLAWWGAFHIGVATASRQDLERFAALKLAAPTATPDQSLWSPYSISGWNKVQGVPPAFPIHPAGYDPKAPDAKKAAKGS